METKNLDYTKEENRKIMWSELTLLMKDAQEHIYEKDDESKKFYNSQTHHYIDTNAFEILFPLDKKSWPDKFSEKNYLDIHKMVWPGYTTYCYMMDVIAPPFIPFFFLHFGYAVVDGKLIRSTFYVVQQMVKYQEWPQGMVIDPLANQHEIKPTYYIGCPIPDITYIENWMISRQNPLEMYVKEKGEADHRERIYNSYMESYFTQMAYEPGWFPDQLIDFAKKERLYIPLQERNRR